MNHVNLTHQVLTQIIPVKNYPNIPLTVADPGFPRGRGANPPGATTYDFVKFSQKLHEIKRIWTSRDGGVRSSRPLRSPTA